MIKELENYTFYIRPGITDMRKGALSLAYIVQEEMQQKPFEKNIFLFCGKNRRTIKAIVWDKNGWIEIIKRLECSSSFKWPITKEEALVIEIEMLVLLLKGHDVYRQFLVLKNANIKA